MSPLRAGTRYRIEFEIGFIDFAHSPPADIVLFGTADCANLPFGVGDGSFGCPTNGPGWMPLGSVYVGGHNAWVTTAIEAFPPVDIHAIAIGPNCREETSPTDLYYFLDNLVLDKQEAFDFRISARNHPCSGEFILEAPQADTLAYQWYKDGVALVGATQASLPVTTGEGRYQLRVSGAADCRVLRPYDHILPAYTTELDEYICAGGHYSFDNRSITTAGRYQAAFPASDGCDSLVIVNLAVVEAVYDTLHARIFEGEEFRLGSARYRRPGQYVGRFSSTAGCDSLVYLDLDFYQVYFPTAFSPDGDGINDAFAVFGGPDLHRVASLEVFDRWGGLQFSGKDLAPNDTAAGWDGKRKGGAAPPGVYVYAARLLMDDGKEHLRYGAVVLMR